MIAGQPDRIGEHRSRLLQRRYHILRHTAAIPSDLVKSCVPVVVPYPQPLNPKIGLGESPWLCLKTIVRIMPGRGFVFGKWILLKILVAWIFNKIHYD